MDFMSVTTRSRVMSCIRGKDTAPEMVVRRYLHARGLRYTLHDKTLPGKPDLVFWSRKVVVFVHGCFWHGHESCGTWRIPQSRTEYWTEKIFGNRRRDERVIRKLRRAGWRVHVVWQCRISEGRLDQLYAAIIK